MNTELSVLGVRLSNFVEVLPLGGLRMQKWGKRHLGGGGWGVGCGVSVQSVGH